jgi:sugar lactone lactonase YvrE
MSRNYVIALSLCVGLVGCGDDDSVGIGGNDGGLPGFTNGVSTLTGAASPGFVDGPRGTARFANPVNVTVGPDGTVFVADFDNGVIRAVDPDDGTTSTVVSQDGFRRPFGMTFVGNTLYVCTDRDKQGNAGPTNGTIWRVSITGKSADVVAENLGRCRGMAALSDGRIAFTDYQSHTVNVLDVSSGAVTTIAGSKGAPGFADGTGDDARFDQPYHLVQRADGKLVVADFGNHRLRVVGLDGTVETFAGRGTAGYADGQNGSAMFNNPQGMTIADNGDIFVTDMQNFRVRRIRGESVETIVGNGVGGHLDHDDPLKAELYGMEGLSVTRDGSTLFVADGGRGEDVPFNFIRIVKM